MKKNKIEINSLRLIPKGTEVFSITLQHNIRFSKDILIKITNTVTSDDTTIFADIIEVTFPATIPGIRNMNQSLCTSIDKTKPYTMPKGGMWGFTIKKDE